MDENWSKDWIDWKISFGLTLKYWNPLSRTIAPASPATMRPLRAFQAIGQQTLDIETISLMLRLLFFFKSLPLSMAISPWTLEILCLRLHPFLQFTATSSSRACSNKTITTVSQCNPGKHLSSTAQLNHPSNHQVLIYNKIHPSSRQIMLFRHTTCSMLL
jgi:hypothetical protein